MSNIQTVKQLRSILQLVKSLHQYEESDPKLLSAFEAEIQRLILVYTAKENEAARQRNPDHPIDWNQFTEADRDLFRRRILNTVPLLTEIEAKNASKSEADQNLH